MAGFVRQVLAHQLTLDYSLAPGWLAPFIEGLRIGKARGRKCETCAKVSFPPLRVCPCGGRTNEWVTLSGTARIDLRTHGTDGAFGFVQFDGADTRATVALVDVTPDDTVGHLMAIADGQPALRLTARAVNA